MLTRRTFLSAFAAAVMFTLVPTAAGPLQTLEQFLGFQEAPTTSSRNHETQTIFVPSCFLG